MMDLELQYTQRFESILLPLQHKLLEDLKDCLENVPHIDQITVRVKGIESFVNKANKVYNGTPKYNDPINQIQDQIGARVVVYFLSDVDVVSKQILNHYRSIEQKLLIPEKESEFGYFGKHFLLHLPKVVVEDAENTPNFFELQIKTLFQHSWGQAEHDLLYKGKAVLSSEQQRMVAFTAAQAWGADKLFEQLHKELNV